MLLLAAGEAGFISFLKEFLADQLRGHEQNTNGEEDQVRSPVEDRSEDVHEDQEKAQKEDQAEDRVESLVEDREKARKKDQAEDRVESSVEDREEARSEDHNEDGEKIRKEDQAEGRVQARTSEDHNEDREKTQKEDQAEGRVQARTGAWWNFAWVCSVIATFVISNYSWEVIFFTSALMLIGIFILFMFGISFYHSKDFGGDGSSFCNFIPVIKASLLNRHLNYPSSPDQFHEN